MFATVVFAQSELDVDQDNIKDSLDKCPKTEDGAGLPFITRDPEFLGCSCAQIRERLDIPECANIICSPERELAVQYKEEPYNLQCGETYCDGEDLYDFPEPTQEARCLEGILQKTECTPVITKNSEACKLGLYPQLKDLQKKQEGEQKGEEIVEETQEDNFLDTVYEAYRSRPEFDRLSKSELEAAIENTKEIGKVREQVLLEQKEISGIPAEVLKKQITIIANDKNALKNILIIEKINQEVNFDQIIYEQEPEVVDEEAKIIFWRVDRVEDQKTISYLLPTVKELDSETYMIADSAIKANYAFWIPIAVAVFVVVLAYIWFRSDVKKKREQ